VTLLIDLNLDQYESHDIRRLGQNLPPSLQQYNVLLSNPLHNLSSYFQMNQPAPSSALITVQPATMPHQQHPGTSAVDSPTTMPKHHVPLQHHHTHPKLPVRGQSPEEHTTRQRTESHHQMSRSSPQRQLSPKVSVLN
jgi:hypothetical protein